MVPSITTLKGFLEKYSSEVELLPEGTKVRFLASNHEMKADNVPAMLAYIQGKAYVKAKKKQQNEVYDFAAHEPFIVPHKSHDNLLYCTLTNTTLPKDAELVKRHIQGRKFIHHKEQHDQKERAKQEREEKRKARMEATAEHNGHQNGNDDGEKLEMDDSDVEHRLQEFMDNSEKSTPAEKEEISSEGEPEKEEPMDTNDDDDDSQLEMDEDEDAEAFWIRTSAHGKKGKKKEWDDDDDKASDDSSSDSDEDKRPKSKQQSRKANLSKKSAKSKSKSKKNGGASKPAKAVESKRRGRAADGKLPKKVRPSAKQAKT